MKKILLISVLFLTFGALKAQDIYYTQNLSSQDKQAVNKAKETINRAERIFNSGKKVYNANRSLLESGKKRKIRKGEKKSYQGKVSLKQSATYYDKGYQKLFEVYYNILEGREFKLDENKQKALELKRDAEEKHNQAQKILKGIKSYSEKDLKKNVKIKRLMNQIESAVSLENQAVANLVAALKLYDNEEKQIAEMRDRDNKMWNTALSRNTLDAYNEYLSVFPDGLHAEQARKKIAELEEQIRLAEEQQAQEPEPVNLVYRVQILASKEPWTPAKIRQKIYPGYGKDNFKTFTLHSGVWYKYYIGEFNSYKDAKNVAKKLRMRVRTRPFVVGFVDDQPVDILQALQVEGQK